MRGLRGWNAVVAVSAAVVVAAAAATGIGWLASRQSHTVTYSVAGRVSQVDVQLASGQAMIVGSSSPEVQVRRTDDYAFGHAARERRWVARGILHIISRCPRIVLGSCAASYELAIPQGMGIRIQTKTGDVRMTGYNGNAAVTTRSGDVDVEAYCGFHLSAQSDSGSLHVATACAPQRLSLETHAGDALALVPPGRYRIGAISGQGRERITGVVSDPNAPFTIDVGSSSGSVAVEGGL